MSETIDVTAEETLFDDAPETQEAPAPVLDREDVLRTARMLAAQITGVASLFEARALELHPIFLDSWRRWAGDFLGWHYGLERLPFDIQKTGRDLVKHGQALAHWRARLTFELTKRAEAKPEVSALRPSTWPWWAQVGVGVGLTYGAYKTIQWVVSGWNTGARQTVEIVDNVHGRLVDNNSQER